MAALVAHASLRAFFDGSFNKNYQTAAFIIKQNDEIIASKNKHIVVKSSVYAEYSALLFCLQYIVDILQTIPKSVCITIHGDCKPVILTVRNTKHLKRSSMFEDLMSMHRQCRELYVKIKRTHKISLEWIPRSKNAEVDHYSRPQHSTRVTKIRESNTWLVEHIKSFFHGCNIQQIINDFMKYYTGKTSYFSMTDDQVTFFYNRVREFCGSEQRDSCRF